MPIDQGVSDSEIQAAWLCKLLPVFHFTFTSNNDSD